jgi:hypothetical protein
MKKYVVLKYSILPGAIYFALVSIAHLFGFKVPVLFVYFNVPSNAYQDNIISFLAFGWAVFMFSAFFNTEIKQLAKAMIIAGYGAVAGLVFINLKTDFTLISSGINTHYFWIETLGLAVYLLWLTYYYRKTFKNK